MTRGRLGNGRSVRRWVGTLSLFGVITIGCLALWVLVPMVFGLRPVAIASGSMSPSVRAGDVVMAQESDGSGLGPGTVVVFADPSGDGLVTHRISAITPDGTYVTKGDANGRADSTPLPPAQVVATGRILVPIIAAPLVWLHNGNWLALVAAIPMLVFAVWSCRWAFLAVAVNLEDRLRPYQSGRRAPVVASRRPARSFVGRIAASVLLVATATLALPTLADALFGTTTANTGNAMTSGSWAAGPGTAVWRRSGQNAPQSALWLGSAFGTTRATVSLGQFRIMQGAVAPTRDEAIVFGVDSNRAIRGEIYNGTSWSVITPNPFATVSESFWWGLAVAYESQSGDAILVWNNGTTGTAGLSYRVWNGSSWSSASTITTPQSGEPKHMRLAADPTSDEMVLIVSNTSSADYALVWNGSSWGNSITLDTSGGDDRTDVFVAYEQQSGDALVTYGKTASSLYFRTWNGTAWSAEGSQAIPGGVSGNVRWTVLGADPNSDRIGVGVLTGNSAAWLAVWNGASWGSTAAASAIIDTTVAPAVAIAFEGLSGEAVATYAEGTSTLRYRTWSGSSWSAQLSGPNIGGTPNSMVLYPRPDSNEVMVAVQDGVSDLNYVLWSGAAWGTPREQSTDTAEVKNQPFVFLWGVAAAAP